MAEQPDAINIIFDGPPSHEAGRFVEVEDDAGNSIRIGEWSQRSDGLWALRIVPANGKFPTCIAEGCDRPRAYDGECEVHIMERELEKAEATVARVEALAADWEARGEHDMAYSKTIPDEYIAERILEAGAEMVENARKVRNALAPEQKAERIPCECPAGGGHCGDCYPVRHNHMTRDIKPKGQCPACDQINEL